MSLNVNRLWLAELHGEDLLIFGPYDEAEAREQAEHGAAGREIASLQEVTHPTVFHREVEDDDDPSIATGDGEAA